MIALRIDLNGRPLGTAGTPDLSVLSAIVSAVGKLGPDSKGARGNEDSFYIDLSVSGLTSREAEEKDEHMDWIRELLAVGDSVKIEVVETTDVTSPSSVRHAKRESDQARYFKWAKDFYFANRDKYEAS